MRCATSGIWSTAALIMTMAVITSSNLSAGLLRHTREVDLLESGVEREARPWGPRLRRLVPPGWAVVAVVVLVGVLAVARVQAPPPAGRTEVDVLPERASATTVQGVARGELEV